jgi:uncharacterized repeat protein (TIGR03803 family)
MFNSSFRHSIFFILISALHLSAQPGNLIWGTWSGGALNNGTILNYNTGTNVVKKEFDFYRTHIGSEPFGGVLTVGPDSMIYGTTSTGTFRERGNIFKYNPYDSVYTEIYEFKNVDAVYGPCNDLYIDSTLVIYGTSSDGGGYGSIYKYNLNTNLLTILHQFNGLDGSFPLSGLTKASNGLFYGVTNDGGIGTHGVIYSFDPVNNNFSVLYNFSFNSANGRPLFKLIEYSPGVLYGVTEQGGVNSLGTIFKFNVNSNTYTNLYSFNTATGGRPNGPLLIGSSGLLYGTTDVGGVINGTIFSFDPLGNQLTVLYNFIGATEHSGLCEGAPGVFYGNSDYTNSTVYGAIYKFELSTGLITYIHTINDALDAVIGKNGYIKHPNNRLYGYRSYAYYSKPAADGTLFSIDPVTDTVNREFIFDQCPMGYGLLGSYLAASDGNLYGINDYGHYFFDKYLVKYTPSADTMEVLHTFQDRNPWDQSTFLHGNLIEKNGVIWGCIVESDSFPDGAVFTYDIQLQTYNEVISFDTIPNFSFPRYFQMGADGNFYGICYHKTDFSIEYIYRLNPVTFLFDTLLRYDVNSVIGQSASGDLSFNQARTKFSGMSSRTGTTTVGNLFIYDIIGDSLTFALNLTDTIVSSYFTRSHHLINDSIIIGINIDPAIMIGTGLIWKLNLMDTTFSTIYTFPSTVTQHYWYQFSNDNYNLMSDGNLYGVVNISQDDVLMRINPITESVTALNSISFQKGHEPGGKLIELPVITGIVNTKDPSLVNLYPNPCNDFIVLNGTIKNKAISIYDINVRVIREMYSDDMNTRINTTSLKQGFYLLRYFDGEKYTSMKFIKN